MLAVGATASAATLQIEADRVEGPQLHIDAARLMLDPGRSLSLQAEHVRVRDHTASHVRFHCVPHGAGGGDRRCAQGRLQVDRLVDGPWTLDARQQGSIVTLALQTRTGGRLVASDLALDGERGTLLLTAWPVASLSPWWPTALPALGGGVLDGTLRWRNAGAEADGVLTTSRLAFADADGSRAAERLNLRLEGRVRREHGRWQTDATLRWLQGELYWQPLYLKADGAPPSAHISARWSEHEGAVPRWDLDWPGVGRVEGALAWQDGRLRAVTARSDGLQLAALYPRLLQPMWVGSVVGDLEVQGRAAGALDWRDGRLTALQLDLDGLYAEDRQGRLALYGLSGHLPWQADGTTSAQFAWQGGHVLQLPFDAATLAAHVGGARLQVDHWVQPLLGGTLSVDGFSAERRPDGWYGGLNAKLDRLSLTKLTAALGWPRIDGELDGELPRLTVTPQELRVFGPIEVQAFDGIGFVRNLRLQQPFGQAPVLTTDVALQHIDLGQLTRALSFGSIDGRVDAAVDGLTLIAGKPVSFDADIRSSAGDYRRRISQRAVQNISSLGGGSAAAFSSSFLRVFQSFGYRELGLSCRLRNGVCEMGGVAPAPQGYYLVVGGGVPSINVIGYNRRVNWSELVERLKRVTQGGRPVVR